MIAALLLEHSPDGAAEEAAVYAQIVVGATERLATRPGTSSPPTVEALTRSVMDVIWCGFATLRDGTRWEPPATA
jgi:hypothetical protein